MDSFMIKKSGLTKNSLYLFAPPKNISLENLIFFSLPLYVLSPHFNNFKNKKN